MTNLSPAAEPAGTPHYMADIIDSLKRLERIGDESSKTVEKIISAASDIEKKIVSMYKHYDSVYIRGFEILSALAACKPNLSIDPELIIKAAQQLGIDPRAAVDMSYTIEYNNGWDGRLLLLDGKHAGSVSRNRENALKFASDLAKGLLKLIEHDLTQKHRENLEALSPLDETARVLSGREQSDQE